MSNREVCRHHSNGGFYDSEADCYICDMEQQLAEWRRAGEDVVSKLSRSQRSGTYQTQYTADADSIDHIAALLQESSDE